MRNWKDLLVTPEQSILDVMKIIEKHGKKFAIVCDQAKHLKGIVTDGDIRRGLLAGIPTTNEVSEVMNKNPKYALDTDPKIELIKQFENTSISYLLIVNADKHIKQVVSMDDLVVAEPKANSVVLMAGGLGSRLGELTTDCPKPMLKIAGKPILETIISKFKQHGFSDFHISVNYKAEMIEDYFKNGDAFDVNIHYLKEPKRLGTAGSLSLLPKMDKSFLVMNGDVLVKVDFSLMQDYHEKKNFDITIGVRKYEVQIPYGVLQINGEKVYGIEEKPLKTHLISTGVYVLDPTVLSLIPGDTYFDMTSLIDAALKNGLNVGVFEIDDYWIDIGHKDDFLKANNTFKD